MPFNGSGTYNLPAGNPVSSGTPISSTTHNATNNDIASALTNCLTRDGQAAATASIKLGNNKITGMAAGTANGDAVRYQQAAKIDEATGVNSDIKSITGLTTMLATNQGGTGVSSSTGTGSNVLSNSPTLVAPVLGTPTSGNLANCTFPTFNQNTTGSAATAINLAGGSAGRIPYQTAAGTTGFTAGGTSGQVLKSNGTSAPSWGNLFGATAPNTTYYGTGTIQCGINSTAIGAYALSSFTTGSNNTCIGYAAGTDAVATITTQDNYVVIGNNSTTNANIKVAWTVTSDARDKTNFADVPHGLDFVNQLKPTAYQFKLDRESDDVGENAPVRYGFKAQDILELESNNPVIINNDDIENLKYNESSMIPILVKAIQELTAEVNKLKGV